MFLSGFRTIEPETVVDACEELSDTEPEDPVPVDPPASDSGKGGYISCSITFSLHCLVLV